MGLEGALGQEIQVTRGVIDMRKRRVIIGRGGEDIGGPWLIRSGRTQDSEGTCRGVSSMVSDEGKQGEKRTQDTL